jgi:hypothetical protein
MFISAKFPQFADIHREPELLHTREVAGSKTRRAHRETDMY